MAMDFTSFCEEIEDFALVSDVLSKIASFYIENGEKLSCIEG